MTPPLSARELEMLGALIADLAIALPWEYHEEEMFVLPSPSNLGFPNDESKREGWVAEAASHESGRAIVALANAWPRLLAELLASRAAVAQARAQAIEECAKAECYACDDGVPLEHSASGWRHVQVKSDGPPKRSSCAASAIRALAHGGSDA